MNRKATVKSPSRFKKFRQLMLITIATSLAILPAQSQSSDDNETAGFLDAYACGKDAAVNIESIPALEGFGIGGSDRFISATSLEQLSGAGYVWSKFGRNELTQIDVDFDGDPKAVDVRLCFHNRMKLRGLPEWFLTNLRLSDFTSREIGNDLRRASIERVRLRQLTNIDVFEMDLDRIHLRVTEINDKPVTVRFGNVKLIIRGDFVAPRLLSTPLVGFRACNLEKECGPSLRDGEALRRSLEARADRAEEAARRSRNRR